MAIYVTDYNDLNETIISLLKSNNTSTATYPLATSITAIDSNNITNKDLEVYPIKHVEYPFISVRITGWEEEAAEFGNGLNYDENITGEITCLIKTFEKGASETELWKFIRNVRRIMRGDQNLSNYNKNGFCVKQWYSTSGDTKVIPHGEDSAYIRAGVINFVIEGRVK